MADNKYRGKQEFYFGDSVNGNSITVGPYKGKYYKTIYKDCLYFATDTREILMNGQPYDGDIYDTTMEDSLEMPNDVGGIPKGTTAGDLKNKTYNQLLDDLLFPTILPVISPSNAPIFSLSTKIVEVGTKINSIVSETFGNPNFNKGQILLNGVSQGDYAGDYSWPDYYESIMQNTIVITAGTDGFYTLDTNNTSYICSAKYSIAAGTNIPKDNKGNTNTENSNIPAKYPGVSNQIVTGIIKTTAPIYATTNVDSPTTIVKQTLKDHTILNNRTYTLTVAAHNKDSYPTTIKVPGKILTFYEQDTGKNFVEDTLDKFTISNETINGILYTVYTQNDGGSGSRTIKFTFDNN